ncbi:MAG: hypothetical protein HY238_28000 [Acidobacteria bacterium]|nr:hypothetical protein [Acidobacteriota bacterium]
MSRISELFGVSTTTDAVVDWGALVSTQNCPYLGRKCLKNRKSQPDIAIGTCTVRHGADARDIIICPFRLLERKKVFTDCLHLLTLNEPGNELHLLSELSIPGGSVDYVLVAARSGKVKDFVGIEFQTLDTTGTTWPERQRFLQRVGLSVLQSDAESGKPFGMNWKMTAKTILVQLHHKIETFESIHKHFVLVPQDHLLSYMRREFSFGHLNAARIGDAMHIHAYGLVPSGTTFKLELGERLSTNAAGIARCLGLQVSPNLSLEQIIELLEARLSTDTLLDPLTPAGTTQL